MPSTLAQLRTKVSRDLRDPTNKTFLIPYIDDLINAGIEEISRLAPREVVETHTPVVAQYEYASACDTAFRCEVWRSGRFTAFLTQHSGEDTDSQNGWDLFGGYLRLPKHVIDQAIPASDSIRLWGYAPRAQLLNSGDVSQLDDTTEWGVRRFARAAGFDLMQADRALFKQWQAMSQNTDISPNQMSQMVSLYRSEWDRQRNYLRRLRRQ